MAYILKRTFRKKGNFEKADPGHWTYAKIHCIVQKYLYDKLEVADFKYDYSFSLIKFFLNQVFLVPKLTVFSFARNFAF